MYIEDKASGQSLIQELRNQSGIAVLPYKVVQDKVARLNAITPLIEGGRVFLPNSAPWLDDFLEEAQQFPSGKHDDQIDALSMGIDALSRMSGVSMDMLNVPIEISSSLNANFPSFQSGDKEWVDKLRDNQKDRFTNWGEL